MDEYITDLPEKTKANFQSNDAFLNASLLPNYLTEIFGFETAKLKLNQFFSECLLFFHNIEDSGVEYFDDLYKKFFKRLMMQWMIILPYHLKGIDQVESYFKVFMSSQLESAQNISLANIYKKWLDLWDNWVVEHRELFIKELSLKLSLN